jgi:hypothetical protein
MNDDLVDRGLDWTVSGPKTRSNGYVALASLNSSHSSPPTMTFPKMEMSRVFLCSHARFDVDSVQTRVHPTRFRDSTGHRVCRGWHNGDILWHPGILD